MREWHRQEVRGCSPVLFIQCYSLDIWSIYNCLTPFHKAQYPRVQGAIYFI